MNQFFICAGCGAENEINIELSEGDHQRVSYPCDSCEQVNLIDARFNYAINEFELVVSVEDSD